MDQESFCFGFLAGALLFGGAGYILQQMQLAQRRAKVADVKQPIPTQVGQTPRQTVKMSGQARLAVLMWALLLIALVACIGFVVAQVL
ncbi:MAG TPA: hypothetical protein VLC95_15930 [Anaerolineae bacterium]|nr:hypothetical protein [Anaerolineae bacterium]